MTNRITITPRTFHFKQPAGTSRGIYTSRKSWFVTVSDGHHTGTGECAPLPDLSCDALPHYEQLLRQWCDRYEATGRLDVDALRPYPSMLFGLETALLHQQRGPILFPTPFSRGETGIRINGLVWMGTFDEMSRRIDEKLAQGFTCIKLKIGAIDFNDELTLVRSLRERYPLRQLEIRLDANGAFTPSEALYRLELLSQYGIHSIEQPIRQRQWALMAELCRESPLPIALDEELIGIETLETKRQMLHIVKPSYIVIKPSLHGGISGTLEWVEAAREQGIGSWITSALESNVGLDAIAQLASSIYGDTPMAQGLGTGQLFTDNIPMPLEIRGERLFRPPLLSPEGEEKPPLGEDGRGSRGEILEERGERSF
jgi:o-succinylbenzoate synthase